MRSRTRVSKHAKARINERVDSIYRACALSRIASRNGYSKGMFQGDFQKYLLRKSVTGARVKVYKDNIYIFGKNSKKLITTYSVPKRFLPVEQYMLDSFLNLQSDF